MIGIDMAYRSILIFLQLKILNCYKISRKPSDHGHAAANVANPKAERTVSRTFSNLIIVIRYFNIHASSEIHRVIVPLPE